MKAIFVVILFFFSLFATAQKMHSLVGLVKDKKGNAVPGTSIALVRTADSVNIQQTIADDNGFFSMLFIADGTYFITASSSGFQKKKSLIFTIKNGAIPFDTLRMNLSSTIEVLSNVTVTARKPLIENRIDKTVVNVDAFLNNAGNTLLEALANSPNVDVDVNGSINVKGRVGVLVLIDGKQSYLTGSALTDYLNSIPASQVDQIEIITQPSAKYEAAGNSGVINIKMKKEKQKGLNANISLSYMQGFYPRTLNSIGINYRINKWNFFVNADYNFIKRYTHRKLSRYIQNDSENIKYFQDENDISISPDHSILVGADCFPAKNWTLGILYGNRYSGQENDITDHSTFNDLNDDGKIISYLDGYNAIKRPWINNSVGMSAKKSIDKKRDWSADLNYENYYFNSRQNASNYSYDTSHQFIPGPLNPYIQEALLPVTVDIFSAKTDMVFYFGKLKIETGLKTSFTQSKNNSSFYFLQDNMMKPDSNLTNYYNYHENINAAYFNFDHQVGRWEIQAGLRLEETNSSGLQRVSKEKFANSYMQLFPTLYIGYSPSDNNNFTLSYARRIERPYYADLNPFLYLIDPYTYRKGNPDLKPYFSNGLELGYNYKGKLNADLDYGVATGIIDNILYQNDSTKILLQTPANLNKLTTIALNVNYNFKIKNWTAFVISYSLFNNHYTGQTNHVDVDKNVTTNLINFTEQFYFHRGWSAELSIFYRDKILLNALATRGPRKVTGFAIGKTILKDKGSLKLRVTDPFYIQQSYGSTLFGNIHTTTNFNEDSRRIGLTFTYRFQQGVKGAQRKIYSPEENKRVIQN